MKALKNKSLKKVTGTLVALSVVMSLSGCSTMFGSAQDRISILSQDPEAKILVNGTYVGKGNADYALAKGKTATITAEKSGCSSQSIETTKKVAGLTWLNLFFWPGFIVDAATGSIQQASPTNYSVTPVCQR
ncbi:hypothetical protein GW590_09270 [Rahnella sp. SAP-1]|uniref:PEGA domain-containing protein n=1 Tax=Rouxiella aceris TaxID=2703884 RepID=A0A848MIU4_9GAMM|nr:hypothetical protein [Rouxiella aceris]NMP27051.1 hypothetical protein [Rouxiella aceris]